jgi:kanosamine-6-phosphate phosphatase
MLSTIPTALPFPRRVSYVVCCDLDETYIPYSTAHKPLGGITALEQFLREEGENKGVVIGWVTGTDLQSAFRKARGYIRHSPHFVCCSLGTEFYWIKQQRLESSAAWQARLAVTGFDRDAPDLIVAKAQQRGMLMRRQSADYQGAYRVSYYYQEGTRHGDDFAWLEDMAARYRMRCLLAPCNPAAGDPAGWHDVDFVPRCCGKDAAVDFLRQILDVPREKVIAFGDSCNDLPMFAKAGHGFLVGNADPQAKRRWAHCLEQPYCHGIVSVLRQLA